MKRLRDDVSPALPRLPPLLATLRQEPGLAWPLLRHLLDDAPALLAMYDVLCALMHDHQWLFPLLHGARGFSAAWFPAYRRQWPGELVHTLELDYLLRERWPLGLDDLGYKLEGTCGVVLDMMIGCVTTIHCKHGIGSGAQFYAVREDHASKLITLGSYFTPLCSSLVPGEPPSRWPVALLKLRRLTLLLFQRVAVCVVGHFEAHGISSRIIERSRDLDANDWHYQRYNERALFVHSAVFNHMRDGMRGWDAAWDRATLQAQLAPTPGHYDNLLPRLPALPLCGAAWWHALIGELYDQVEREMPWDPTHTLLQALRSDEDESDTSTWAFAYDNTEACRAGYYARLRHAVDDDPMSLCRTT